MSGDLMFALNQIVRGLLLAAIVTTTGCASLRSDIKPVPDQNPLAAHPAFEAAAETELPLSWTPGSMFVLLRPQVAVPVVPNIPIKNLSFAEVGVQDALRLLASQAGLTVRVEGGSLGSERYGPVTMENLSGTLSSVLDEMSEAAGFFWTLKGNTLIIRQDDQFMVNLPPVLAEDTLAGVTNTLQFLGARDVYLDRAGRTLTFTANKKGMESIQGYLENVRATRSLLVYDTHVFQVDLRDGLNTGIQWNQFGSSANTAGLGGGSGQVMGTGLLDRVGDQIHSVALSSGAPGIGLALNAPKLTLAALLNFMATQGTVKSLSSPQLTMLSNSKGTLRVGKTITYVSKVGSNSTTGISQVTTETASLRLGLMLELQGDLYDQTVFTRVHLAISDVTDMTPFTAIGTQLTLPQTADRDLEVTLRSRPGDAMLLGGIHIDSENKSAHRGATGVSDGSSKQHSELVLVLRARVIKFSNGTPTPPSLDLPVKRRLAAAKAEDSVARPDDLVSFDPLAFSAAPD